MDDGGEQTLYTSRNQIFVSVVGIMIMLMLKVCQHKGVDIMAAVLQGKFSVRGVCIIPANVSLGIIWKWNDYGDDNSLKECVYMNNLGQVICRVHEGVCVV